MTIMPRRISVSILLKEAAGFKIQQLQQAVRRMMIMLRKGC